MHTWTTLANKAQPLSQLYHKTSHSLRSCPDGAPVFCLILTVVSEAKSVIGGIIIMGYLQVLAVFKFLLN